MYFQDDGGGTCGIHHYLPKSSCSERFTSYTFHRLDDSEVVCSPLDDNHDHLYGSRRRSMRRGVELFDELL